MGPWTVIEAKVFDTAQKWIFRKHKSGFDKRHHRNLTLIDGSRSERRSESAENVKTRVPKFVKSLIYQLQLT